MAQKSHKNNKHIAELIESATVTALQLLAQVDKFAMLGGIDASLPDDQARAALREHILKIKREDITIADQEAVRLLQLVRFRTEEMLAHAYRELEFEQHAEISTFDKSADAMTRLIWLHVKASRVFDQIETTRNSWGSRCATATGAISSGRRKSRRSCTKAWAKSSSWTTRPSKTVS